MGAESAPTPLDRRIAVLATHQHGVVSRAQLLAAGVGRGAVAHRMETGRLHRLHRGVYAVGHAVLSTEGRRMAAVLACGPGAVLSHRTAAHVWGIRRSASARIEVSVPSRAGRERQPGIVVHRPLRLPSHEMTTRQGIPLTTLPRTLVDLAEVVSRRVLERALDEAENLRLFDLTAIAAVIDAHRTRTGAARLAAVLAEHAVGTTLSRSDLEERFLGICAAHGVPRPAVNAIVHGLEVDFYWPHAGLVVEVDSTRYHATRRGFERDRERDALLATVGVRVVRYTGRRLLREPAAVGAQVVALTTR